MLISHYGPISSSFKKRGRKEEEGNTCGRYIPNASFDPFDDQNLQRKSWVCTEMNETGEFFSSVMLITFYHCLKSSKTWTLILIIFYVILDT